MPPVHGILETALYCEDLPRAVAFYRDLFGLSALLESERLVALDVAGRSVLLLFQQGATEQPFATPGGVIPAHGGAGEVHFAFGIDASDWSAWEAQLARCGVPIESQVQWPGGARSIYFRDPDRHAVELITRGFWRTY